MLSELKTIFESRAMDVVHSTADTILSNLKIFFEFLNDNLLMKEILDELMTDLPDAEPLIAKIKAKRRIILPSSHLEKVKACLSILLYMIEKDEDPWQLMAFVLATSNVNVMTEQAMKEIFVPVCKYIDEETATIDSFRYLLIRFKLKSEWFGKEYLFNLYNRDSTKGESMLDSALRAYLFDQGINFPFSSPRSPSGEVDILSVVEQKPIPLEVKVFDGDGRSRNHIKQGFRQAFLYARDYGEPSGYLVIFNVSPLALIFELSLSDVPQRIVVGDKTVFLLVIDLYPHEETASRRTLEKYTIDEEYLLQ